MIKPVLLFSGGHTSGYMLRRLLDTVPDYREKYLTIFCNTGREMPQTLDFVRDVQENWEVPVVWLEAEAKQSKWSYFVPAPLNGSANKKKDGRGHRECSYTGEAQWRGWL